MKTSSCARKAEKLAAARALVPDGSVPYVLAWGLAVPQASGVYVINDVRGALYVGKTNSLRRRFEEHLGGSHNPLLAFALRFPLGVTSFTWMLAVPEHLQALEAEVVRLLQPICNLSTPKSSSTFNLKEANHG